LPRGTCQVEPYPGATGFVAYEGEEKVLECGLTGEVIGWGFGPDERDLVIHSIRYGEPG
jgi:hypothetical protein